MKISGIGNHINIINDIRFEINGPFKVDGYFKISKDGWIASKYYDIIINKHLLYYMTI